MIHPWLDFSMKSAKQLEGIATEVDAEGLKSFHVVLMFVQGLPLEWVVGSKPASASSACLREQGQAIGRYCH